MNTQEYLNGVPVRDSSEPNLRELIFDDLMLCGSYIIKYPYDNIGFKERYIFSNN